MRIFLISIIAVTLNACSLSSVSRQSSHEASASSSTLATEGTPFHSLMGWSQGIEFYVSHLASDQIVSATIEAAKRWNQAVGWDLLIFAGIRESSRDSTLFGSLEDNVTMIYVEQAWQATTGKSDLTLATTVWENDDASDRIVKGDVVLNTETYRFVDATEPVSSEIDQDSIVDAESVMVHEFGHLIGLDHVEVDPLCDSQV